MTKIDKARIENALLDVSRYDVTLGGRDAEQPGELPAIAAPLLEQGFCVCYGTNKVLARHGLDIRADREQAYQLLESLFRSTLARIDVSKYSVTSRETTVEWMDFDGYNVNQSFSHDGQIAARSFVASRCIHFDAATPFIGNIYGPNENIAGGHPLICDTRQFCTDRGLDPKKIVTNLPNNYNIAIKDEYYDELLADYSFALQLDLDGDIAMLMLLNEVAYGVGHGATDPVKKVADQPARRPLRHQEMQYLAEEHYPEWYAAYGLQMLPAGDYAGENVSLDFYDRARPFDTLIPVPS
jgi:hypothetical protein